MAEQQAEHPIRAAGALIWRASQAGPEIVLVHRPRYDDWSYPKGKAKRGEHVLQTATREIAEETGLRVALGRRLTESVYEVDGRTKQVSYWTARCLGSAGFVPDDEVDELTWLQPAQVADQLSYQRDRVLLDEFTAGPVDSVPFILLRHAQAGAKSADRALDLARPLDDHGAGQARLLADLLASYGRCRVLSSAAERCVATVRPYADAVGTQVEVEPAFTVPADPAGPADRAGPADPAGSALVRQRVAELALAQMPTLICAHNENLATMAEAAYAAFGVSADPAEQPMPMPPLPKGGFLVLQSADQALASAERQELAD
jgi:8-oxo-(d)GTP phosphatase